LVGSLKVTIFGEINDVPLAMIQVFSTDKDGNEQEPLFAYELPLNFKHDCDMSDTLYAVKGLKGQFFGFLFQHPCDKEAFCKKMQILRGVLEKRTHEVEALRHHIEEADMTID